MLYNMAGALMQLVAYGAQDVYLTAEPTVTFWKAVYRRHTNFAMESMSQTLSGTPNFGNKVVCRISRMPGRFAGHDAGAQRKHR